MRSVTVLVALSPAQALACGPIVPSYDGLLDVLFFWVATICGFAVMIYLVLSHLFAR